MPGEQTTATRRSSRIRKARDFDEESTPSQRRRTEKQVTADKAGLVQEREERREAQLAKQLQREAAKHEKEERKIQRQREREQKKEEKEQKRKLREAIREEKRAKKAEVDAQKALTKELKAKAKKFVKKKAFTAYLKEQGVSATSSPEALSTLLRHARQYHAEQNGSFYTKISQEQIAAMKVCFTGEMNDVAQVVDELGSEKDLPVPLAPESVHTELVPHPPLSQEEALARANSVVGIPVFEQDEDNSDDEANLDVEEAEWDFDSLVEHQEPTQVNVLAGPVLNVPLITDDTELKHLKEERAHLEQMLKLVQERSVLRAGNQDLRKEIAKYQ